MEQRLFIVGAGSMSEAFIRGIVAKGAASPSNITVCNRSNRARLEAIESEYGVHITSDISRAAEADVIFLGVKPADAKQVLETIFPYLHGQVFVSFAAGIPIQWFEDASEGRVSVIRAMPNLPVAVFQGATAMASGMSVSPENRAYVKHLLTQIGRVVELPEELMDAATAFSGSGPGFVCYFLEAMENAAVKLGFPDTLARELLLQTVVGTAMALQEWELSPEELRRRVTSPSGTTHAGVTVFDQYDMNEIVCNGIKAAADRSAEMGNSYVSDASVRAPYDPK